MSSSKLKDRIDSYINSTDYKLLNKLPTIICVNGKSFFKTTSLIDKPFCHEFTESMLATALKLSTDIEGTVFSYYYNDEIVIITRNDQNIDTEPWFDNRLQKIASITSSIATNYFNSYNTTKELNLFGESLFYSHIFAVPNIAEAINTVICKQQQNFHSSVHFACFYELLKKYDKNTIREMLMGLSVDEKINLLSQECGINFNDYSSVYRRGAACYKSPKIVDGSVKNKWTINTDLPIFTKDQTFLNNIFKLGSDIFRKESD